MESSTLFLDTKRSVLVLETNTRSTNLDLGACQRTTVYPKGEQSLSCYLRNNSVVPMYIAWPSRDLVTFRAAAWPLLSAVTQAEGPVGCIRPLVSFLNEQTSFNPRKKLRQMSNLKSIEEEKRGIVYDACKLIENHNSECDTELAAPKEVLQYYAEITILRLLEPATAPVSSYMSIIESFPER